MKENLVLLGGIILGAIAVGLTAITLAQKLSSQLDEKKFGGISPEARNACVTTTSSSTTIGPGNDTVLLGTTSERSFGWVQVEPLGTSTLSSTLATTTVQIGFDDIPSASSTGVILANGTSTLPSKITFGLDTEFPTVGRVKARAPVGSTTVHFLECVYPD